MDAHKLPLRRRREAEGDENDEAVKTKSSEGSRYCNVNVTAARTVNSTLSHMSAEGGAAGI